MPVDEWKPDHYDPKPTGRCKSSSSWDVYSNRRLSQEMRKVLNNLTSYLKELEKGKQVKPKVSKRKQIIKIRAKMK